MKRVFMLCLVVLLATSLAAPAFAQVAPADLGALARWVPAKAPLYIGFRTDDDYIAVLDSVAQRLNAVVPDGDEQIPPLFDALDQVIADSNEFGEGATFQTAVRSWLGDVGALTVITLADVVADQSEEPPGLIILEVTDRAAAEDFWSVLQRTEDYTRSTEGDMTVFTPPTGNDSPTVGVMDDVAFIASTPDALPSEESTDSLATTEDFSSTLALLPEETYNIVGYLNVGEFIKTGMQSGEMDADMLPPALMTLLENYPPAAFGATTLDARSFAIDFAVPVAGLEDALAEMGLSIVPNAPINPNFVERVPAGTPLLIHSADLQAAYNQSIASIRAQAGMMANMDMAGDMSQEDIETGLSQATIAVQGVTGLDLETELLPALTGDYALYLGLNPAIGDATSLMGLLASNPINFGILLSVNDPAVTSTLVDNLTSAIQGIEIDESTNIEVTTDTIGDNVVNVVTVTSTRDLPFPVEIVIGGDEEVFFIGTPDYARAALNPDGGLLSDPQYQEATSHTLGEMRSLAYLASAGLQPLVNVIEQSGNPNSDDAANLAAVLGLLSSSSISSSYEDGVAYGRAVWTFPE
jgi:hypothetical protein